MQHRMLGGGYTNMDNEYDQGYGMEPVNCVYLCWGSNLEVFCVFIHLRNSVSCCICVQHVHVNKALL